MGRYTLTEVLGEGGWGRVYGAWMHGAAGFRKAVAVKLSKDGLVPPAAARAALAREARLGGVLRHRNVVQTLALEEVGGRLWVVMERVEGVSLHQVLARCGALHPADALAVLVQAATGAGHVHGAHTDGRSLGLVHRDLKPANLLLDAWGVVKVADFGTAWMPGEVDGEDGFPVTPGYVAPEQVRGDGLDARTDVFALGAILATLVLGRSPFKRDSLGASLAAARQADVVIEAPGIRGELDHLGPGLWPLVRACTWADPQARLVDAQAVAQAAQRCLAELERPPELMALARRAAPGAGAPAVQIDPAAPPPRTNLGVEARDFFGRERELGALAAARAAGARVVTLKGLGGSGKTRLAQRWAHSALDRSPVWWVSADGVPDAAGLADRLAMAWGMHRPARQDQDSVDRLGRVLAGRGPTLLVFDACEGVAGAAKLLRALSAAAPEAWFLCTSRRALGVPGEAVVEVGPMAARPARALLAARVEGAGAPPADPILLAEVARRLDHLPLALELAGPRLGRLSPHELLAGLAERFGLADGPGADPLALMLQDAWTSLDPWAQEALRQLRVFVGPFDLAAATAVLDLSAFPGAPWPAQAITHLLDQSLLVGVYEHGLSRMRMLGTVRDWMAAQTGALPAGAAARHRAWFARFGQADQRARLNGGDGGGAIRALRVALPDLDAALDDALDRGDAGAAVDLARAVGVAHARMGPFRGGEAVLSRALQGLPAGVPGRLELRLLRAFFLVRLGKPSVAHTELEAVVGAAQDDPDLLSRALGHLSDLHLDQGRIQLARQTLDAAAQAAHVAGGLALGTRVLVKRAALARRDGRYADALRRCRAAVEQREAIGDSRGAGLAWGLLGTVHTDLGALGEARRAYESAQVHARRNGDLRLQAQMLNNLGEVARLEGRPDLARSAFQGSIAHQRYLGLRRSEALARGNLGVLMLEQGELGTARDLLAEASEQLRGQAPFIEGTFRAALAEARLGVVPPAQLRAELAAALTLLRTGTFPVELGLGLARQARVLVALDDEHGAATALAEARDLAAEVGARPGSELHRELQRTMATIRP